MKHQVNENIKATWMIDDEGHASEFYSRLLNEFGSLGTNYDLNPLETGLARFLQACIMKGGEVEVNNDKVRIEKDINQLSVRWEGQREEPREEDRNIYIQDGRLFFVPSHVTIEYDNNGDKIKYQNVPLDDYLSFSLTGLGYQFENPYILLIDSGGGKIYEIGSLLPFIVSTKDSPESCKVTGEKNIQQWLKDESVRLIELGYNSGSNSLPYYYDEGTGIHRVELNGTSNVLPVERKPRQTYLEWQYNGEGYEIRKICEHDNKYESIKIEDFIQAHYAQKLGVPLFTGLSHVYVINDLEYRDYVRMLEDVQANAELLGYKMVTSPGRTYLSGSEQSGVLIHQSPFRIGKEIQNNCGTVVSEFNRLIGVGLANLTAEGFKITPEQGLICQLLAQNFSRSFAPGYEHTDFQLKASLDECKIRYRTTSHTEIIYERGKECQWVAVEIPQIRVNGNHHTRLKALMCEYPSSTYSEGRKVKTNQRSMQVE